MPQDHHYIPAFYLRRWTDEGGPLYGFRITSLQASNTGRNG
jgi:hypothetical protein